MSSTETNSNLLTQITSHCFNKDRTQVAVGVPTSILIYDCSKSKEQKDWKLLHTLIEVCIYYIYIFFKVYYYCIINI